MDKETKYTDKLIKSQFQRGYHKAFNLIHSRFVSSYSKYTQHPKSRSSKVYKILGNLIKLARKEIKIICFSKEFGKMFDETKVELFRPMS